MKSRNNVESQTTEAQNGKMKHKDDKTSGKEKDKQDKNLLKESLLLPSTSIGKTTSASICEKSNVWAEHRLGEKKNDLDHMLYKTIVRLNSDRLEVVSELADLKKSSSTGNLNREFGGSDGTGHFRGSKDFLAARIKSNSGQTSPAVDRKMQGGDKYGNGSEGSGPNHSGVAFSNGNQRAKSGGTSPGAGAKHITRTSLENHPASSSGKGHRKTVMKKLEKSAKISIKIGSDSSSDEADIDRLDACEHHQNSLCLTHGRVCRRCGEARSQSQMVENVTRRYAKQLSAKKRCDK